MALFARVVDAGGFTAAAKSADIPQTTISRRIAKLEDSLGARLLERTTRKVVVTEIGQRVYHHARRIIDEVEGAQTLADSMQDEPIGLIRISAPVVFGQHILRPALARFLSANPKVQVQLDLSGRRVDLVGDGFDTAIRVGPLEPSSLIKRRIMWANAAYFARADIACKVGAPEALANCDWLDARNEYTSVDWKLLHKDSLRECYKFTKKPRIASSDIETLISCAEAGLGVAVLPVFSAPPSLERVLPEYVSRRVEINALTASHKSITPAVRSFLDHLEEQAQSGEALPG
ncbi:LysR substrate-binding domain-containing protein [uncultured Hoeflea sp.]|uniref:LysR substrate-binding domain-containing protein n=1 Tax=uncultured Hoeflea sp. TaxID=538666 RepID=UPI0026335554|nr:LysR substrate-binding domain-containing protein [uncultured Hoeflea sp.]